MSIRTPAAPRSSRSLLLAGALVVLAGCTSVTPIGKLLNDPARYDGKTVSIRGQVRQSAGGLGVGAYEVRDATGTLTVVSRNGAPPPTGAQIQVKGIFQSLVTLGGKALAILREQSRSSP